MEEEVRELEAENRQLRQELDRAKQEKSKKSRNIGCLIGAAGCLVLGIPMLVIMAAVALPMYSTFKQKVKVGTALRAAMGSQPALIFLYEDQGAFANLNVPSQGGTISAGDQSIGAGLPGIDGLVWTIEGDDRCAKIQFNWTRGCPPDACNGYYEICCDSTGCVTTVRVSEDDWLGFNEGPVPIAP